MQINRNNYESFFIDYLDGSLDPRQVADLLLFLEENPDLKEELENLDSVPLEADANIQYPAKDLLRKKNILSVGPINEQNFQEYLIASMEGDLSFSESRFLERFILRNPTAAREMELYKATKLLPDPSVVYPRKRDLKKYPFWISYKKPVFYMAGVAATLLLLLTVFNPFNRNEPAVALKEDTPGLYTDVPSPGEELSQTEASGSGFTGDKDKNQRDAYAPVLVQTNMALAVYQPSSALPSGHISPMPPIHKDVRYQLINASYNPAGQITRVERNSYSQALPYLVMTDQYALSPSQQNRNEYYESLGAYAWTRVKGIFSGRQDKGRMLPNFNLWTLADIGVVGINQLTDSELHIQRIKDEEGNIISYALIKENQEITRTRKKNSPAQNNRYE